ncbi:MAG TPA: HlyD family efflux transporter periplasmic adaptor subunit [Candidatus Acidoferrum sp.]|jgi:multidrug efflux pump subunit AcrA (membrane-fusion protein)|nr:HlyD family efflux transporter periplasmic adaptor subunit [Candidatus Acidoferrum sp.]
MGLKSQFGGKPRILFLGTSCLLILIVLPFFFGHFRRAQASTSHDESTVRVERKKFSQTLRLNGTTMAARSFAVLAPRLEGAQVGSMVITKLAAAGSQVKKGDLLVEFDPQEQMKDYLDKKATFDNLVSQVAEKKADEDIARAKDDTAMKQAEDELKRAQLELQRNEIVSRIDAEKNEEAVDEGQVTLKQLKETYQLKRAAAAATIRIQEIQRDRAQEAMRYAQSNAAKMTVHSPMTGVVVFNTIWLGGRMGTVQQGDQVRPGLPFMAVVDPSQMEVRVELNQVDLLKLHPGQRAKMHLDAYPGTELAATLEDLSPLGHPGQFTETVRIFAARFSIQGTDPKLLPDLSAALDLDLGSEEKVLAVPYRSVDLESGNAFVWVKGSGSFEKRAVKTGSRNDTEVVVLSGLEEGELVRRFAAEERPSGERP